MITKTFDFGWGAEWPIKQIENTMLAEYLKPLQHSDRQVVLINSTWYSRDQHQDTMAWLQKNSWDIIVIVAMIDCAIVQPDWFHSFNRPVIAVGGYDNEHYISCWAEVVSRYMTPCFDHDIDTAFMCLNRKPHWHRQKLYAELAQHAVLDQGLVSMGCHGAGTAVRQIPETLPDNSLAPNGQRTHHGIVNDVCSLGDMVNWRRHFLNVVTETVFDINQHHFVSEKIFKPILGRRPFLVYDPDGATQWLTRHGFRGYTHSFSDITDLDLTLPGNMAPFLKTLCAQPASYWRKKYLDLLPTIDYNLERFSRFVQEQRQKIKQGISCPI